MSEDSDLDRWEIVTAVIGLHGAYRRAMDAYGDLIRNQEVAGVSVAEFVFWACALDERLRKTDTKYAARRDADEQGQVLPALRFIRDRHTHQVAVTTAVELTLDRDASPDLLRLGNRWLPLDSIRQPPEGHERDRYYPDRQAAYKKHLEGRKPAVAMGDAIDFLNREVAALGIKVPDPQV